MTSPKRFSWRSTAYAMLWLGLLPLSLLMPWPDAFRKPLNPWQISLILAVFIAAIWVSSILLSDLVAQYAKALNGA